MLEFKPLLHTFLKDMFMRYLNLVNIYTQCLDNVKKNTYTIFINTLRYEIMTKIWILLMFSRPSMIHFLSIISRVLNLTNRILLEHKEMYL